MASGKTVSATISSAYGCFWMSFAVILIPGFGVREAYDNDGDYYNANGFFMLVSVDICVRDCQNFNLLTRSRASSYSRWPSRWSL